MIYGKPLQAFLLPYRKSECVDLENCQLFLAGSGVCAIFYFACVADYLRWAKSHASGLNKLYLKNGAFGPGYLDRYIYIKIRVMEIKGGGFLDVS